MTRPADPRGVHAQRQFVIEYLRRNFEADACNQEFHDEFHALFGGARHETYWGAQTVYKAQRLLKAMADDGTLERYPVGLGGNWQPGFPRWVYGYTLRDKNANS